MRLSIASKLILAVSFILTLCSAVEAQQDPRQALSDKDVYNALLNCDRLIKSKRFDQALPALTQLACTDGGKYSGQIHYDMALCKRGLKQFQAALESAQRAFAYDDKDPDIVYLEALISRDMGEYDLTVDYLNQYMQMNISADERRKAQIRVRETRAFKNVTHADRLMLKKKYREAICNLREAASLDPTPYSVSIHNNLVLALRAESKFAEAIEESKTALKLDPNNANTVYAVALSHEGLGNYAQAIAWLNKYLSMDLDINDRASAESYLEALKEDERSAKSTYSRGPDYFEMIKRENRFRYWDSSRMPIKIYLPSKVTARGYKKEYDSFITSAFDTWSEVSGHKVSYRIVLDKSEADIVVRWVDRPIDRGPGDHEYRTSGLTECEIYRRTGYSVFADAQITIMTVDPWNLDNPMDPAECAAVCIHEVGHALGLGHSSCIADVMYFRTSNAQTGLPTSRDAVTLARIYQSHPVVASSGSRLNRGASAIKYLPPPCFRPPKLPGTKNLSPPLFTPPPLSTAKLKPPMYTPPPLPKSTENGGVSSGGAVGGAGNDTGSDTGIDTGRGAIAKPLFTPPPLRQRNSPPPKTGGKEMAPPLFVPEPLKKP